MTEQAQSLQQQLQQQATQSVQNFYGNSVGTLKDRIQSDRAQLESHVQQMPQGDARNQVQQMIDYYTKLENSIDQATQEQGVQPRQSSNGAVQQSQSTGNGAQTTERTLDEQGYITQTTLDGNGEVVDEDLIGNVSELPVEDEYIDEQGRIVSRVSDDSGNAYEMVTDDSGNMVEARSV